MKTNQRTISWSAGSSLFLLFALACQAGSPSWMQLIPAADPTYGTPSLRILNSTVYNTANKRLIVFGGGGGGGYGLLNDVWVLSNADGTGGTATWTKLNPSGGAPGAREMHAAVYDQANNRMIIQGGYTWPGRCEGVVGDVWVLSNADGTGGTPAWTQLSPTGTAPARRAHSAAYDSVNNRLIISGGAPSGCGPGVNDTWVLTNANGLGGTPGWIQLTPTAPAGFSSEMVMGGSEYDPAANTLIQFLQVNGSVTVWLLSNANGLGGPPAWSQLAVNTNSAPVGLNWGCGVYDLGVNKYAFFGGGSTVANAVWTLANANGAGTTQWTQLAPTGTLPAARTWFFTGYAPGTDRLTIFGGSLDNWNGTGEVWVLADAGMSFVPLLSIWPAVELNWGSRTGKTYTVSWTTDLATTNWMTLTNVAGNGTTNVIFDSTKGTSRRFYRITEQP